MKNYKQILEAINRGIKFALDDFEDNDLVQGQVNSKVKYKGGTKEYLDLMNDVVDLGLPAGTLWCKYNLDVNPNLLSNAEDWYGGYYAWGELESNKSIYEWDHYSHSYGSPKSIYDWDHYSHGYGPYDLYKYVNNKEYAADDNDNKVDNLTLLLPEDDAAYQFKKCHNFKFHIPTKELCEELINCTNNYWVNNYDPNKLVHNLGDDGGIQGLDGRIFEGKNKNQLFIPAAGFHNGYSIYKVGSHCKLWSSSLKLNCPSNAYFLDFDLIGVIINSHERYIGHPIRPVINL